MTRERYKSLYFSIVTSAKEGGISIWSDGGFVRKLGGVAWTGFVLQGTSVWQSL